MPSEVVVHSLLTDHDVYLFKDISAAYTACGSDLVKPLLSDQRLGLAVAREVHSTRHPPVGVGHGLDVLKPAVHRRHFQLDVLAERLHFRPG